MSEGGNFNEDDSNIPEAIELIRDSENQRRNTVIAFGAFINSNKDLNRTENIHNEIAKNLRADSQEIDENNDADPEEMVQRDPDDMKKSLDNI